MTRMHRASLGTAALLALAWAAPAAAQGLPNGGPFGELRSWFMGVSFVVGFGSLIYKVNRARQRKKSFKGHWKPADKG